MKANWERIISENMEPLEVPGRDAPIYKPMGAKASVSVLTDLGEFPPVQPPLDRHDMIPCGGRELTLDASDPDFLLVHKTIGVCEYSHCIPWEKVVDIVFYRAST